MDQNNDIYELSGRIKNLIAFEGLGLSPAGLVLVNMQTHFLKKLYDFSDTVSSPERERLISILREGEDLPRAVMSILTPKEDSEPDSDETEYEDVGE